MSDEPANPAFLFTPVKLGLKRSESSELSDPPDSPSPDTAAATRTTEFERAAALFVELPRLTNEERSKYVALGWEDSDSDDDADEIVKIVGEHKSGDKLYLFASHKDGIFRRKEDWEYKISYPELYEDYCKRKASDTLEPFDPSASYVRPKDRVRLILNVPRLEYKNDSEETTESSEDNDDEDDDYYGKSVRTRSKRARTRSKQQSRLLPYSPVMKRTRTGVRKVAITSLDGSDESSEDEFAPTRRSTRTRSRKNYAVDNDNDSDFEMLVSSEDGGSEVPFKKKIVKRKAPKPEYGRIRDVNDVYDSDPDTAPLRAHRDICEKCRRRPAHRLLKSKKKGRRKSTGDMSDEDDVDFSSLGGWVRCLKCPVSAHWACLAKTQRDEIVKAARAKADAEMKDGDEPVTRFCDLDPDESTEFVCGSCVKGGICLCCKEVALDPELEDMKNTNMDDMNGEPTGTLRKNLFRCVTCKRLAHYSCLSVKDNEDLDITEVAITFQENGWECTDCASYRYEIDKIIAWRPSPLNATDSYMNSNHLPNLKEQLPREYLVKWVGRSYRRTEWVPHMWLATTHTSRLKNFYTSGPKIELLDLPYEDSQADHINLEKMVDTPLISAEGSRASSVLVETKQNTVGPPKALPDAEQRIPPIWKTVDRVLDVVLWNHRKINSNRKRETGKESDDNVGRSNPLSPEASVAFGESYELGIEPPLDLTETVDEFEDRVGRALEFKDIARVAWAFTKWDDLPYDEATWDSPPRPRTPFYTAFEKAFSYFILSKSVTVKKMSGKEIEKFEGRNGIKHWNSDFLGVPEAGGYDIGQNEKLKLMPFQIDGVNWLCRNWFHHQQCILADEMGLGKTVQIITFLGILEAKLNVSPALIVVPNSTITNWVREFERWAPRLRVVPFYGEQKSRDIVKKYELFHKHTEAGTTGAKYHVLVTTYETVTGQKDFLPVFKKTPRWEVLVVDEGQRLKSDTNLIFRRLNELNSCHRIIMTGTPLNNNIRELFNLMNFLDPDAWDDLEGLTKQFEELNEDLIKDLHDRLRPFFLRRVKAEVLDLPPKNEVIVPLSMAPLQKEIYKSILSKNFAILRTLTDSASSRVNKSVASKSNLRNMLMQLRKCLQHPYLISDDIEPKGLSLQEAHNKLISASGKLRFLRMLLPKLKERGHRVLLFSQFVIALNIIEDFLQGEGYKFLRLDGDIKQAERQKGMDEFNREGSDIFIYILSTRAGGVGINLWSADTVIIFDPDFNPHQDLQAIARAHRFGQKKTCLVFKLMTKDSAEERIIQTGKKKLVLDHLIVQKINEDEDNNDVQSMLTFGAKALFDEANQESRDINYTEQDVEKLIEKTELEGDSTESVEASNNAFAFAKVWSSHKDTLDEMPDASEIDQDDSWAQALAKFQEEQKREQIQEKSGRGVQRKAAQLKTSYFDDLSPEKVGKKRRKSVNSDDSDDEFKLPKRQETTSDDDDEDVAMEVSDLNVADKVVETQMPKNADARSRKPQISSQNQRPDEECALCFTVHESGGCFMTQKSENLIEYRKMLMEGSDDDAYDEKVDAIRTIDETLTRRGHSYLIPGQPLKPPRKRKKLSDFMSLIGEKTPAAASFQGLKTSNVNLSRPVSDGITVQRFIPYNSMQSNSSQGTAKLPANNRGQPPQGPLPPDKPNDGYVPYAMIKSAVQSGVSRPKLPDRTGPSSSRNTALGICEVCGQSPYHMPVQCPIVAQGPKSVLSVICKLANNGGRKETIDSLKSIYRRQTKSSGVN